MYLINMSHRQVSCIVLLCVYILSYCLAFFCGIRGLDRVLICRYISAEYEESQELKYSFLMLLHVHLCNFVE